MLVALLAIGGCGSQLPSIRPETFTVERTTGGGMTPESDTFRCSGSECTELVTVSGQTGEIHYPVTPRELDVVYRVLRERAFDRIEVRREEEVHDRGGTTVRVDVDGHTYRVADAGLDFVVDVEDFRAVLAALAALQTRLADTAAVSISLVLGDVVRAREPRFSFDPSSLGSRELVAVPGEPGRFTARLAPGTHVLLMQTSDMRALTTISVTPGATYRVELDATVLVVE
jgi:hypothetical protein